MTISAIANIVNGQCNYIDDIAIDTLIIDSRKVVFADNAIFICLLTDNDNGHYYIAQAYAKGIRHFLISQTIDATLYSDACFVTVANTLTALQTLVANHRQQFKYPVIGITGSNGKTIVKEWLFQLLDGTYQIVRSPKSFNSQIGVALSVWEMQSHHNLGIFEAGISMPKEMAALQKMIQPSIGIFTTIGDQHAENFTSTEQKIIEKLQLFTNAEVLIINTDNTVLHQTIMANAKQLLSKTKLLTWGKNASNDLQITKVQNLQQQTIVEAIYNNNVMQITIPFTDNASIENACHCWLACMHLGISHADVAEKMLALQSIAMRLELKDGINNCSIINDSYNNDIGALHIALNYLEQQTDHQLFTVVLSDILQSNQSNYSLYEEVADLLVQKKVTKFIGIGEGIKKSKDIFRQNKSLHSTFFDTTDAYLAQLDTTTFNNECILLKGARKFQFEKINIVLEAKIHQTVLEVNMNALTENYQTYCNLLQPNVSVMAMVKAFSYGSGAYEVANKLQFLGVDYLAVAYTDEGVLLRESGIHTPIMVMNPDIAAYDAMIKFQLEPEIYSLHTLHSFITACIRNGVQQYPIHLKIDTGMHRLGFTPADMQTALPIIVQNNCIQIKGVFSHLAASDDPLLDEFTKQQAAIFDTVLAEIEQQITTPFHKHICNTSGIVRHPNLHYNMVRLGVGLYGVDYSQLLGKKIKNISRLKTSIAQLKHLSAGDTVGYSRKGVLHRNSIIGTVCIGYADGINRTLGNGKGLMYIKGVLCPIVGNVCMDMCMLDVTDVPNVQEGDEVIVFGPELPITRVAEMAGTIAYEIMTDISTRVKRVYYEE
jgi:Alr-MurF fusion protein